MGLYTSMIAFETIKQGWVEILSDKKYSGQQFESLTFQQLF